MKRWHAIGLSAEAVVGEIFDRGGGAKVDFDENT